jgi:transcriptional regulator with PAS, ATPase and Fis domain
MDLSKDYEKYLEAIQGLMVIDDQGKLVYLNEQCADYIKVDRKKSLGKFIKHVFPPSVMYDVLKGDEAFNIHFYFMDGRMSVSAQVQLRHEGRVVGVLEYDMIQNLDALDVLLGKYNVSLREEMAYYKERVRNYQNTKYNIHNIIGSSKKIQGLKRQIELAAVSNTTVVITGETGTGKELVAHSIHNLSSRAFNDFVKVNGAGMPENLVESELFGYEEGAFTGAKKGGKKGKFELANKGTLFIDEINQMPLSLQPKILRVLQEGEIDVVGSEGTQQVDVRIIAATNENLYDLVKQKRFREDLYYRLNVFPIEVPPLRERLEDMQDLVEYRLAALNRELGKHVQELEPSVYRLFEEYHWPGNVRELYNVLENAMIYAEGTILRREDFRLKEDTYAIDLEQLDQEESPIETLKREVEEKLIREVLQKFHGNKTQAASFLKISRPLLYQKMKRLGIETKPAPK